jgi:DNA uptake protein ComE-like DNA-binding protein
MRSFILAAAAAGLASTAQAQTDDPNYPAVQAVCGRCHGVSQFMDKAQSWERWNDVFRQMTRLGANGSDQELEQVTAFFLDHLTTLNVNSGNTEEIAWVLNVSDDVAQDIIARRQKKPFATLAELGAVPGVSRERLERLKSRIQF